MSSLFVHACVHTGAGKYGHFDVCTGSHVHFNMQTRQILKPRVGSAGAADTLGRSAEFWNKSQGWDDVIWRTQSGFWLLTSLSGIDGFPDGHCCFRPSSLMLSA